jgi:subtilisin family serine protease
MKRYFSYLPAVVIISTLFFPGCMKQSLSPDRLLLNQTLAAVVQKQKDAKDKQRDEYIVVFKEDLYNVEMTVDEVGKKHKFKPKHLYKHVLKGFAGKLSPKMLEELRTDPRVAYIEEDAEVSAAGVQTSSPSWGMDRIDQRSLPLDNTYTYHYTGASVDAYIFDSGIRHTHRDFQGRIASGFDPYDNDYIPEDENGHGTHVAATVGGTRFGVAKAVRLIPVRVLGPDNFGSISGVVAGFDWATHHHTNRPAVGNVSLGAQGSSPAMEQAVRRMIADGITVCLAAGNQGIDAAGFSPGRAVEAITVGASDIEDNYVTFSNHGPIVDVFAPGFQVNSAWLISDTASLPLSGTSMATPHVAGTAALYLEAHPNASPAEVQHAIKLNASTNLLSFLPAGTPNRLLNSVWGTPPAPAAPFAPALILPEQSSYASIAPIFSWDKVTGATSYTLQIAEAPDFSSLTFHRDGITATSLSGIMLNRNTTYHWRVKASNAIGSSEWSRTHYFTAIAAMDETPFGYIPANAASNVVIPTTFAWTPSPGARAYRLQVSTNREFTKIVYSLSNYSNTTTTVTGLAPNTTYYWRVSATFITHISPWSEPVSFTTWGP